MTSLRWGAVTDVGRVRTNNEDSLLVESPLFAVADGVGGHAAGEVASAIAVATLKTVFGAEPSRDGLADAVRRANEAIYDRAMEDPNLRGMGTTVTAVALVEEEGDDVLAVVNVGDSRAYRMRDGELEQITDDHSLVEEMVRAGRLSAEQAFTHPQRNIVTRALGLQADVEVDCFGITPFEGDRFVLASDGLTDEVPDPEIASILRRVADPDEAARELVELAKTNGGRDNVTVVIVDVVDDDGRAVKASAAIAAQPVKAPPVVERSIPADPEADREPDPDRGTRAAHPPAPVEPAPRRRRFTLKAALFLFALIAVLAGAFFVIGLFARGSYHVGIHDGEVVIYQGRPGGLLWFDPTVKERTGIAEADVPPAFVTDVRDGKEEPTLAEARRYVANIEDARTPPPTSSQATSTTTTTTTTAAPPP